MHFSCYIPLFLVITEETITDQVAYEDEFDIVKVS